MMIVHDPDDFFLEVVAQEVSENADVYYYSDPELFRYDYEREYRPHMDEGSMDRLLMIVCNDKKQIPYDIYSRSSVVDMSLNRIFPMLDIYVLKDLNPAAFEPLYKAYPKYLDKKMTAEETMDFIASRVFNVDISKIKDLEDLITAMLSAIYNDSALPEVIVRYIAQKRGVDADMESFADKSAFMEYLQNQWERFVKGKVSCDFKRFKIYVDNLFTDGYLKPVEVDSVDDIPAWMMAGVYVDKVKAAAKRMADIIGRIKQILPILRSYKDWLELAGLWAEVSMIRYDNDAWPEAIAEYERTRDEIDTRFREWLLKNYGNLPYISYAHGPVMVHQIPLYLKRQTNDKKALIVMDGMSVRDWSVIKSCFGDKSMGFHESRCFAWIPTITPISRRAIFSGRIPMDFKGQAFSSYPEEKEWIKFWGEAGIPSDDVAYYKFSDISDDMSIDCEARIIGIVIDAVDGLAHASKLSVAGLHENLRFWMKSGRLEGLLNRLMENGYEVYITSDHGNIESVGLGNTSGGFIPDIDGERAKIYNRVCENEDAAGPGEVLWPGYGLPKGYTYYIIEGKGAYTRSNHTIVGHGGISLEEVIVPFIHLRKDA